MPESKNDVSGTKGKKQGQNFGYLPQRLRAPVASPSAGNEPDDPEPTAHGPDRFYLAWLTFIHRQKTHELLRIMEEEQLKLQALRQNPEISDFLIADEQDETPDTERMLYMKSAKQELDEAKAIADITREHVDDPDFVRKSVLRLFRSRVYISDDQLEVILSLCRNKTEQKELREAFAEKRSRDKYLHNSGEVRHIIYNAVNSYAFNRFMLTIIFFSTAVIILLTIEPIAVLYRKDILFDNFLKRTVFLHRGINRKRIICIITQLVHKFKAFNCICLIPLILFLAFWLHISDAIVICVFILEAGFKLFLYKMDYFHNFWNMLDIIVISTFFLEIGLELITRLLAMNVQLNLNILFKFCKSLRSLRLLRAIKFLPSLQVIASTIIQSILSLGSIALLIVLFIFLFAVTGRGFFNEEDPIHFGNIWVSCMTLFQLLTLDDWFDILDAADNFWMMFTYLFVYIIVEYFVFLNLFVAVLVDNFQLALKDTEVEKVIEKMDWSKHTEMGLDINDEEDEVGQMLIDTYGDVMQKKALKFTKNKAKGHKEQLDLPASAYFNLPENSEEVNLIGENMKILNSLDFHNFIFVRRLKLLSTVLEQSTKDKESAWDVHDDTPDFGIEDSRHSSFAKSYELSNSDRKADDDLY